MYINDNNLYLYLYFLCDVLKFGHGTLSLIIIKKNLMIKCFNYFFSECICKQIYQFLIILLVRQN